MRNAQTFLRMETPPLRVGMCPFANGNATIAGGEHALLRMETPLRGRSGGHTGAAPTISRMAPCPKVAGEVLADGLKEKRLPARCSPTDKNKK